VSEPVLKHICKAVGLLLKALRVVSGVDLVQIDNRHAEALGGFACSLHHGLAHVNVASSPLPGLELGCHTGILVLVALPCLSNEVAKELLTEAGAVRLTLYTTNELALFMRVLSPPKCKSRAVWLRHTVSKRRGPTEMASKKASRTVDSPYDLS